MWVLLNSGGNSGALVNVARFSMLFLVDDGDGAFDVRAHLPNEATAVQLTGAYSTEATATAAMELLAAGLTPEVPV